MAVRVHLFAEAQKMSAIERGDRDDEILDPVSLDDAANVTHVTEDGKRRRPGDRSLSRDEP